MKVNILLLFLFFNTFVFSQNTININEINISLKKLEKNKKFDSLANQAYKVSVYFYRKKDYEKAIKYSLIEIQSRRNISDSIRLKKALFNQGLFLYHNKQYYKSLKFYQKVIDSFKVDKRTYRTFCNIGRVYSRLNDYYSANYYFEKGMSNISVFNNKELFSHYINYAIVQNELENEKSLKKELLLIKKADSLSRIIKLSNKNFNALNFTYANYYQKESVFNFNKSKYYYNKVLMNAINNRDTAIQFKTYNMLSSLYSKVKKDSTIYYINRGVLTSQRIKINLAKINYRKSIYNYDLDIDNALKFIKSSLYNLTDETGEVNFKKVIKYKNKLFYLTKQKAKIHLKLFEKNEKEHELEMALKNLVIADKLLDLIKEENLVSQSKLFWQKEASEVYINAVKTCNLLNRPEDAFYFIEKNKALLLLENISENQIREQANIPVDVLERELELKQKINHLENQLSNPSSKKDSLETVYYDTKIELVDFIQSLKTSYPEYHNLKKPIEIIKLNDVQKNLDEKTMILEYILNDNGGFVLSITKKNTKLHEIKNINNEIENFISSMSKPTNTNLEKDFYTKSAFQLYKTLIPFSKHEGIEKLVVIPDYTLQNIPFEALLTSSNPNSFLINDYEISYNYSLSFLDKNKQVKNKKKSVNKFLGVAPFSFKYDNLTTLINSKKEITTGNETYDGDVYLDSLATKSNFTNTIENYNIIHLATHANANDSIAPWIAFRNQKMYLNEIQTLKNNAEMVVLSACNTSIGEIKPGEGAFSLARGFFYSGSKSVVSSLWSVNDKSNQKILSDFYSNLKDGKTKSQALREAKLKYINNHELSEKSPYYWSSIILIGDSSTIPSTSIYPYLIGVLLLIIAIFFYMKRKKIFFLGNKT